MGVQQLTTFAKEQKQPQIYNQVNILDEIEQWRESNNQKNATIIFDVMGFVHNFGANKIELNLGGRQHQYLHTFEQFVTRLIEAGANLAFFCDGQLQSSRNDIWCERKNAEFNDAINAIQSHNGNVVARSFLKRRFGCKTIVKSLLKLIEDKSYGKVIVSTRIDCDLAIAKYASECSALAVIASDSDFLIFEGTFQWWHSNSMDMNLMLVNCFDRTKLLELFNVSREQMKYLATIAGNDHTNHWVRKAPNFDTIADYCRSLVKPRKHIYPEIVKFVQMDKRMEWDKAIECVRNSIESYDLDVKIGNKQQQSTRMDEYCATNVMMFAFWNQQVFQYEVNFIDFLDRNQWNLNNNSVYPFVYTLFDVFRRLAGIMLKNTDHRNATLKIVTKYSFDEGYSMKLHTPIYPRGYIDINAILFGNSDDWDETKWTLLLWSIGLDSRYRHDLQKIPRKYVPTVLALTILLLADEITLLMADTILVSQFDIQEMSLATNELSTQITHIRTECVRVAHMFNRIISLLCDCFMVCGLKQFIQFDWFDGPYFNHLLREFEQSEWKFKDAIHHISKYRIYKKFIVDNRIV